MAFKKTKLFPGTKSDTDGFGRQGADTTPPSPGRRESPQDFAVKVSKFREDHPEHASLTAKAIEYLIRLTSGGNK